MDRQQLLEIFNRQQRIDLEIPGVERQVLDRVVRNVNHEDRVGFILYSKMDSSTVDSEIDQQIAFYQALGYEFEWKVFDYDTPPDLSQRLAARGFEIEDPEALMVLDLEDAPDYFDTLDLSAVSRLLEPSDIDGIVRLEHDVWDEDFSQLGSWLSRDLREYPDLLSVYGVVADGRIVSAAWVYFHPPTQFASLWGGSTLPAYRKRGYYTALLVARAREALQRGFRFLYVDASPMSRPILEKHGFQFLSYSTPCRWKAS